MAENSSIESKTLSLEGGSIHLLKWGSGPELLIAIPGYGERAGSYSEWQPHLEKRFTCYALDLPFHGSSRWRPSAFQPADLIRLICVIREEEPEKPITLAAYSMGGRLLLASLSLIDFPVRRLILIAPDGIHTPGLGAYLFFSPVLTPLSSFLLNRPDLSESILNGLFRLRLLNRRNFLFLQRQFIHRHRSVRLLFWTRSLPNFKVSKTRVLSRLNASTSRVILVTGLRDRVVPASGLRRFGERLQNCKMIETDSNHQVLEAKIGAVLAEALEV